VSVTRNNDPFTAALHFTIVTNYFRGRISLCLFYVCICRSEHNFRDHFCGICSTCSRRTRYHRVRC